MDFLYTAAGQAFKDNFKLWLSSQVPEDFGTPGYSPPGTWEKWRENTYEIYYFKQRKADKKLANGHAEQLLGKNAV